MSEQDHTAVYGMDNPEFDWPGAQPETQEQQQETAEPAAQPEAPEQPAEQPAAPAEDRFGDVAKAIRESERARAQAEVDRAIAERDRQWQQQLYQAPQQPVEPPDPIVDPEGYREWVKQSVMAEVVPQIQQIKQQSAAQLDQTLKREAGLSDDNVREVVSFIQEREPWMIDGLNRAPNPYRAALDYAKRLGYDGGPEAKAAPAPTDADIPPHIRQRVLAEAAAQAAAKGQPPAITVPRGVGGAPQSAGMSDAIPPPSEWKNLPPAELARVKATVYGSNGGAL